MRCEDIDDLEVEVYVLRHAQDEAVRNHLENCIGCGPRVAEARAFIAAMKEALETDETD
jgi:hypothetical protein